MTSCTLDVRSLSCLFVSFPSITPYPPVSSCYVSCTSMDFKSQYLPHHPSSPFIAIFGRPSSIRCTMNVPSLGTTYHTFLSSFIMYFRRSIECPRSPIIINIIVVCTDFVFDNGDSRLVSICRQENRKISKLKIKREKKCHLSQFTLLYSLSIIPAIIDVHEVRPRVVVFLRW